VVGKEEVEQGVNDLDRGSGGRERTGEGGEGGASPDLMRGMMM